MKASSLTFISFCVMIVFAACNNPKESTTGSSDSSSAISETAPATMAVIADSGITGKRWKLIELMGKPVPDSINGKEPFIMFKKEDSSYSANGGCNGLGGKFEIDEKAMRIKFKQGMSTMMACTDMHIEQGLNDVISRTDNYSLSGDSILSLNKARMAPLARFRAVQ